MAGNQRGVSDLVRHLQAGFTGSKPALKYKARVMRSHLVLLAGLLLSSCLPTGAQTSAARIILGQTSPVLPAPVTAMVFRASVIRSLTKLPERPLPHSTFLMGAAYKPSTSLESRLRIDEFRTPLLTESRLPVAHLWRGLKLDVFESTFHSHSWQRGSPTSGVAFQDLRPLSKDQASIGSSVRHDGLSLTYSFGRDAAKKPVQILRCVSWIIGNGHGCPL
jgi:hypothetical protein